MSFVWLTTRTIKIVGATFWLNGDTTWQLTCGGNTINQTSPALLACRGTLTFGPVQFHRWFITTQPHSTSRSTPSLIGNKLPVSTYHLSTTQVSFLLHRDGKTLKAGYITRPILLSTLRLNKMTHMHLNSSALGGQRTLQETATLLERL